MKYVNVFKVQTTIVSMKYLDLNKIEKLFNKNKKLEVSFYFILYSSIVVFVSHNDKF